MVNEKKNNITDDYIILNPPLGFGKIFYKGTYGEVRKAKHRQTG